MKLSNPTYEILKNEQLPNYGPFGDISKDPRSTPSILIKPNEPYYELWVNGQYYALYATYESAALVANMIKARG